MQLQLAPDKLIGLISEVVSSIPFRHASLNAKDILGHVYEYFLGQFALAEGKKGGQYYTPKSIVTVIVEMLEPFSGKVYDPAMGSGGFFVQSEAFIEAHGGKLGQISVYEPVSPEETAPSPYADLPGFCKSATLEEIAAHGHVLTPGRYVDAEEVDDDGEPFEEKMQRLIAELNAQFVESAELERTIKANLEGLGYGKGGGA